MKINLKLIILAYAISLVVAEDDKVYECERLYNGVETRVRSPLKKCRYACDEKSGKRTFADAVYDEGAKKLWPGEQHCSGDMCNTENRACVVEQVYFGIYLAIIIPITLIVGFFMSAYGAWKCFKFNVFRCRKLIENDEEAGKDLDKASKANKTSVASSNDDDLKAKKIAKKGGAKMTLQEFNRLSISCCRNGDSENEHNNGDSKNGHLNDDSEESDYENEYKRPKAGTEQKSRKKRNGDSKNGHKSTLTSTPMPSSSTVKTSSVANNGSISGDLPSRSHYRNPNFSSFLDNVNTPSFASIPPRPPARKSSLTSTPMIPMPGNDTSLPPYSSRLYPPVNVSRKLSFHEETLV